MFSSRKPFGLLKDFQIAEQMIERLKQEEAFLNIYQGEKSSQVKLVVQCGKGKLIV